MIRGEYLKNDIFFFFFRKTKMMKFNYAPLFTYGIKKKYNLKFPLKINTMILL